MCCRRRIELSRGAATAPRARFLIVQTGSTFASLQRRRGDFAEGFRRGLRVALADIDIVRVDRGESLPAPRAYAGIVVSGSPAMVSERAAWSERTAAWLQGAVDAGAAVLGVCYGHQLLAHALGGEVDLHPAGREIGTIEIERLDSGDGDVLLNGAPARFLAHASHQQSVLALPDGAIALARSAHDPHHAVRYADRVWGLQFHPEFSVDTMRDYLRRRAQAERGDCRGACCPPGAARPAPHARRLLARFRNIARTSVPAA